ncbi:pentapeptide repeat-containing protein [Umezawaea endophytica]|uniref:Pentapeptide repeat-containing protein n=1 Tax=Umezawaea endophytica TaxID=1654476 RepID=A0A9X2VPS5_9PSEU|nr:pentapeptide repeat-containing protein [Umezawaea endophytica]MCS7480461.1 pentapeptide repeat-containing protein [Umezawaea endophytica]
MVLVVLWHWIDTLALADAEKKAVAHLDAVKVAASIAVGGGGLFVLYLAARRQRTQELELDARHSELAQHDRAQEDIRHDAEARRVTDLYAKSSEQLGSDKAPVRLAGMYALERLGQDNPHQRLTVINLLCAYLRMPFTNPVDDPGEEAAEAVRAEHHNRVQEREVRLSAQGILITHLRPGDDLDNPVDTFWPDISLNLTGAHLIDLIFARVRVGYAWFDKATFDGNTSFYGSTFTSGAQFTSAIFGGWSQFSEAMFAGHAIFSKAIFKQKALFERATFARLGQFVETQLDEGASFDKALITHRSSGSLPSTWPSGWRASEEHEVAEGRDGTWHRLEPCPD